MAFPRILSPVILPLKRMVERLAERTPRDGERIAAVLRTGATYARSRPALRRLLELLEARLEGRTPNALRATVTAEATEAEPESATSGHGLVDQDSPDTASSTPQDVTHAEEPIVDSHVTASPKPTEPVAEPEPLASEPVAASEPAPTQPGYGTWPALARLSESQKIIVVGKSDKPQVRQWLADTHGVGPVQWADMSEELEGGAVESLEASVRTGDVAGVVLLDGLIGKLDADRVSAACRKAKVPVTKGRRGGKDALADAFAALDRLVNGQ